MAFTGFEHIFITSFWAYLLALPDTHRVLLCDENQ